MEEKLYSMGEVIDLIRPGQYAVSTMSNDKGTFIGVREDGWMFIVYANEQCKTHNLNFRKRMDGEERRWKMSNIDQPIRSLFDKLPWRD